MIGGNIIELKIGRHVLDIDVNDVVLFNGACWALITKEVFNGLHFQKPAMSKALCEKFKKKNILALVKSEKEYETADGRKMGLHYYKFDVKKLEEYLIDNTKK